MRLNHLALLEHTSSNENMALLGALLLIGIKKGSHTNCYELWNADGTGMMLLRALFSYKRTDEPSCVVKHGEVRRTCGNEYKRCVNQQFLNDSITSFNSHNFKIKSKFHQNLKFLCRVSTR